MAQQNQENQPEKVRFGVDDAGYYTIFEGVHRWKHDPWYEAIKSLGCDFVMTHFELWSSPDLPDPINYHALALKNLDAKMRQHGLTYNLNLEGPNFSQSIEIEPGVNEYETEDGMHRWDMRMEWLRPLIEAEPRAFVGLTYDEAEHMLLSGNRFANSPHASFDKPSFAETRGLDIEETYNVLVEKMAALRTDHYENKVPLYTEHIWPDLFHLFARAGWNICPKLLKEGFSPVAMSIALGAANQYEDRTTLWASPDLWRLSAYPGHSVKHFRSALLTGYWLGAETIYVENMSYEGTPDKHEDAKALSGSLIHWEDADNFRPTPHGEAYRDFTTRYVPEHPRTYDWRDSDPKVAIIRLPDGSWGQHALPGDAEYPSRDRLLGNPDLPTDEISREWLHIWPLLTHGVIRPGALTIWHGLYNDLEQTPAFIPMDSVTVFDHLVTGRVLDNIDLFIVCGHALSKETFKDIAKRVENGATCIISRRLYAQHANETLPGDWLIVDGFASNPEIAEKIAPFLAPEDVMRFRFRQHIVEFRQGDAPGSLRAQIIER